MKRVDFEFHYYIPEALEVMALNKNQYPYYDEDSNSIMWTDKIAEPQEIKSKLLMTGDDRIEYMDNCGIETAILSSAPGIDELGENSIELCKKINNDMYEQSKKYPGRILGSASLPMHDPQAACDELKRCVEEMGFVAWHAHSNVLAKGLDEEIFFPIFKQAADLGVYVYLHPRCSYNERLTGYEFNLAGPGLGFTLDAQISIIKLILNGTFDRLPNLTVMLGHLAEGLSFYMDRIQSRIHVHPVETIKMEHELKYYFKNNIMASTSGNTCKESFLMTKEIMGIDRMVIGTDTPFENGKVMSNFLDGLPLTVEEREQLYFRNAESILRR